MNGKTDSSTRFQAIQRIFEDNGFGNIELLESWDGDDLSELSEFLTEEEFQTLMDQLEDWGETSTL